jgi:hypothetical protein
MAVKPTQLWEGNSMAIDDDKLHEFLGKFVSDLGATAAAGSVVIGHNLEIGRAHV